MKQFVFPLLFAIITAAGSNLGVLLTITDNMSVNIIHLMCVSVSVACLTANVALVYWILPQITKIPLEENEITNELIDQFMDFKNGVYARMEEEKDL